MSPPDATPMRERLDRLLADTPRAHRTAPTSGILAAHNGDLVSDPITDELIWSFLVWEAGELRAAERIDEFTAHFVDLNELRVCLTGDIVGLLGVTYPKAAERTERLRATLGAIYDREHGVHLTALNSLGKREARAYLDSLEGIPSYVAGRVALLSLGAHAFPIDARLHALLKSYDALDEGETSETLGTSLERQIRAGEAADLFLALELWAGDKKPKPAAKSRKKSPTKKKSAAPSGKTAGKKPPTDRTQ